MSYSRWISSKFYTFWASEDSKKRTDQVFEICGICICTYGMMKEFGLDRCIDLVKGSIPELLIYDQADFEELKVCMKKFMKDVEDDVNLI